MKKEVIIFGAGKYGKALYDLLQNNKVDVRCFLQNKVSEGESYESIPIYSIRDFEYSREKSIVLLAVANDDVKNFAKAVLVMRGMEERYIFDCSHFIEDNYLVEKLKEKEEMFFCNICGKRVKEFLPIGEVTELFEKHNVIGGGKREHAVCPKCGCLDRNRWCMYVLEHYTKIVTDACTVLHFAPEEGITKYIKTNKECRYYSADLSSKQAMLPMDLTDILFREATFDYIIVNHVMEHIADEKAAIGELKRVLKDDGVIIMSFPICSDQDTFEDDSIVTKADRLFKYGQEDHVRLYGRDYKERLEAYGLFVEIKTPWELLPDLEIEKYGFIKNDIILLCRKQF